MHYGTTGKIITSVSPRTINIDRFQQHWFHLLLFPAFPGSFLPRFEIAYSFSPEIKLKRGRSPYNIQIRP
jgi:hypothetical protein